MKRLVFYVAFVAGCSNSTGPGRWSIFLSNQSDSAINVQAWNEANAGQAAQFNTVAVPAHGSACLQLDPSTWGTTTASLQTSVWLDNAVPQQWVLVLAGVDLSKDGYWSWTLTTIPPYFQTTPAPSLLPCRGLGLSY